MSSELNKAAKGISFYTPAQEPQAGTASESVKNVPTIFKPLTIRGHTLNNRIWVSPMCQYSAADGHLTDWHLVHIGSMAARGPGLTMIEATSVSPEGRITPEDSGLWKDSQTAPLARVVEFIKSQGSLAGVQLAHAGRKASTLAPWLGGTLVNEEGHGWPKDVIGPSSIKFDPTYSEVKEMSVDDIARVVQDFRDATVRAVEAGVQMIEVHGAHGYLLHNFMSPLSNKRTDGYGGSFENRVKFCLEVTRAVRDTLSSTEVGKQVLLFYRLSASDWVEGGWTCEDSIAFAKLLKEEGIDLLDVSSAGNHTSQKITTGPGYQLPFAHAIKRAVPDLLVSGVGMIWTANLAMQALNSEEGDGIDAVMAAREFLRDPSLVLTWAKDLGVEVRYPQQYHRAAHPPQGAKFISAASSREERSMHEGKVDASDTNAAAALQHPAGKQ